MLSTPSKTRSSDTSAWAAQSDSVLQRVDPVNPAQQYFFLQSSVFAQILEQETNKRRTAHGLTTDEEKEKTFWHDLLDMCMTADYSGLISQFPYEKHIKEQYERLFTDIHMYRLQQMYQSFMAIPAQAQNIRDSFDIINDRLDREKSRINTLV